jgi:zinc and cadmium transporter
MLQSVLYALASVILVSLVSLIGAVSLFFNGGKLDRILTLLVSLSAGSLLGGAFFHLIPEIVEKQGGFPISIPLSIIGGILLFFAVEKFIHWRHCHYSITDHHQHHLALMNLVGDGVHNFIDGMIIAVSYLASVPAGIAATIAVVLHEIPQEIGDFGVLLYSGWSKGKALMFNFFSALIAVVGAVVGLMLGASSDSFVAIILPFAAGGFIYIAGTDLIPELHKECHSKETFWRISLIHFLAMVVGIGLMLALTLVE